MYSCWGFVRDVGALESASNVAMFGEFTEAEEANLDLQRRLFAAGSLSEIKPPIRDLTPYLNRKEVPIEGEPISETVIRERR